MAERRQTLWRRGWSRFRALPELVRLAVTVVAVAVCAYPLWVAVDVLSSVPSRAEIRAFGVMPQTSVMIDTRNRQAFTLAEEQRIEVPLDDVSPHLIQAVVAIEDRRFFDHEGFDPIRIAGATLADLRAREAVQGGSTITQQLARQGLGREKTIRRKLKELAIAIELERHYSKREILELYLNRVYFGDGLHGVEAASRGYFGKRASELTIAEAALLAGLLRAPSAYDPTDHPDEARARRDIVLRAMVDTEAISAAEYERAAGSPIDLRDALRSHEPHGAYFKEEARRQLVERFGPERVAEGGLQVFTTLDLQMQRAAEIAIAEGLAAIDRTLPSAVGDPLQAALVAIDPRTGAVRALVGGRDFAHSQYNRAMSARRQPGSAFKPFVYAAALEAGWRPEDRIDRLDEPVSLAQATWTPEDEHVTESSMTLREGLRVSSNRAAVRLLEEVGLERALDTALGFGFEQLPKVPSLALGSGEVTLDTLTAAFGAFANGGRVTPPFLVRRVADDEGEVLFERDQTATRAISPRTAYRMAEMLADVIDSGTGSAARRMGFTLPAGGKTGTTNDYRDAWFVGFTPSLVAGVWVGYDRPRTIRESGYGSQLALPIWTRFMKAATLGDEPRWLEDPGGLEVAEEGREKRGFWARLFGMGERSSRRDGEGEGELAPTRDDRDEATEGVERRRREDDKQAERERETRKRAEEKEREELKRREEWEREDRKRREEQEREERKRRAEREREALKRQQESDGGRS